MTRSTSAPRPEREDDDDKLSFDDRVELITRATDDLEPPDRLFLLALAAGHALAQVTAAQRSTARDALFAAIIDTAKDAVVRGCDA